MNACYVFISACYGWVCAGSMKEGDMEIDYSARIAKPGIMTDGYIR